MFFRYQGRAGEELDPTAVLMLEHLGSSADGERLTLAGSLSAARAHQR